MDITVLALGVLVFGSVVALVVGFAVTATGGAAERLRERLLALKDVDDPEQSGSAIRAHYLRQFSPLERWMEDLPGMIVLGRLAEQAGRETPAYRIALLSLALAAAGALLGLVVSQNGSIALLAMLAAACLPYLKLAADRRRRLQAFEEQLPDALDLMSRSLRAGNPLVETFKFISEEMQPPISTECAHTWSHVNYGVSLKAALMDMVGRAPSVSLRAAVTAILVQRETGGNLAEVLDRISQVVRARARFGRRLRTMTAEGRVSAFVLILMPFVLAAVLAVSSPTYLPILLQDPVGHKLLAASLVLMALGILWIWRIIRVRV